MKGMGGGHTADEIGWDNMVEKLVEAFPVLKSRFDDLMEWWGRDEPPAQHVFYNQLLGPYLEECLKGGKEAELRRIFLFLESLSAHPDRLVQEVIYASVCENLVGDSALMEAARRYMGSETLRQSLDIEDFWRRLHAVTSTN